MRGSERGSEREAVYAAVSEAVGEQGIEAVSETARRSDNAGCVPNICYVLRKVRAFDYIPPITY